MPAAERPRRSPRENWLEQTRERQGTEPQARTELLDRRAADTKGRSNDFSFAYLGNKVASRLAMRGKSTLPVRGAARSRNALVRRHARLTAENPRPVRLDATRQQIGFWRELPSTYLFSVWREKCVAGK